MASRKVQTLTAAQAIEQAWDDALAVYALVAGKASAQRPKAHKDTSPRDIRANIELLATLIRASGGTCETPMEATARKRAEAKAEADAQATQTPTTHTMPADEYAELLAFRAKRDAVVARAEARKAGAKA